MDAPIRETASRNVVSKYAKRKEPDFLTTDYTEYTEAEIETAKHAKDAEAETGKVLTTDCTDLHGWDHDFKTWWISRRK